MFRPREIFEDNIRPANLLLKELKQQATASHAQETP